VPPNAAMINVVLGDAVSREWAELQE